MRWVKKFTTGTKKVVLCTTDTCICFVCCVKKWYILQNAHCKKRLAIFLSLAGMLLTFFYNAACYNMSHVCKCESESRLHWQGFLWEYAMFKIFNFDLKFFVSCENMLCLKFLILTSNFFFLVQSSKPLIQKFLQSPHSLARRLV